VLVHPEITPPSNFYQLRDTTNQEAALQSIPDAWKGSAMAELPCAETLARLKLAFLVSLHILFPVFTIGLASRLAVLRQDRTRRGMPLKPSRLRRIGWFVAL
jgi:hypothetical protein